MGVDARKARLRSRLAELEADPRWRPVRSPPSVDAQRLVAPDLRYPVVRCTTSLACSAAELMRFLVDDITQTLVQWSRDIVECREVQRLSRDERILIVRTRAPVRLVYSREDLFYVHRGEEQGGAFYEVSEVTDEVAVPVAERSLRSTMHFASKHIHPTAGGCRYDVCWQYDPMGWLSSLLPRSIAVATVHDHMKDECLRLRARFGGL